MKLQKQLSRKVGSQKYSKYVVTLPPKTIEKLGWDKGVELELEETSKGILLKRKRN